MFYAVRSESCPPSLTEKKRYDGEDVKRQLLLDFFLKCWLTEEVLTIGGMTIDHFRPQCSYEGLRFSWANLFPASNAANNRRPRKWPEGGLIDPTKEPKLHSRIYQSLSEDGKTITFVAIDLTDIEAVNTAKMMEHLFNEKGKETFKANELRQAVENAYNTALQKYIKMLETTPGTPQFSLALREFQTRVSKNAPFSTFIGDAIRKLAPKCERYFPNDN